MTDEVYVQTTTAEWVELLGMALLFTENPRSGRVPREQLQHVLFHERRGVLRLTASDGFGLIELTTSIPAPADLRRMYPRADLELAVKLLRAAPKGTVARLEDDALRVYGATEQRVELTPWHGTDFPSYEAVIPIVRPTTTLRSAFGAGADQLARLAKVGARAGRGGQVRIQPGGNPTQPIRCDFDNATWEAVVVLQPMVVAEWTT